MADIAIITANFGGYDAPNTVCQQAVAVDGYYFCDTTPIGLHPDWTPIEGTPPIDLGSHMMRAKWFKMQAYTLDLLRKYAYVIWVDGRINVVSPHFALDMCMHAGRFMAFAQHPQRKDIWSEAQESKRLYPKKYAYDMLAQCQHYKHMGMRYDYGLWAGTYFAYANTRAAHEVMEVWWDECVAHGCQDQLSLPYAMFALRRKPIVLPFNLWRNDYIKTQDHI